MNKRWLKLLKGFVSKVFVSLLLNNTNKILAIDNQFEFRDNALLKKKNYVDFISTKNIK
jgi:hypothetical protein